MIIVVASAILYIGLQKDNSQDPRDQGQIYPDQFENKNNRYQNETVYTDLNGYTAK